MQVIQEEVKSAVIETRTTPVPQAFALMQNYPNPFNSSTVIHFNLPTSDIVDLSIYNIAGQKVATLAQGMRQAGTHVINWNGKDDNERLQLALLVLTNCCIDLLDQTGQVVRDRACENADRRTVAIASAIAEFFALERASDVLDVERRDTLSGTQPGFHICCFRNGRRHDQQRSRRNQHTVHPSFLHRA